MFCGENPTDKNKEHVIPRWLLEMTGSSTRVATFAPVWNERERKLDALRIPFRKFAFPACRTCNERFSDLEASAKQVMEKLVSYEAVSSEDLGVLLSWLDKVRTGLWLAFYFLQKNVWMIDPHMAIADRIDRSDRLVFIYRSVEKGEGVSIMGANTPAFQYLPVAFGLVVNDLGFLNASTDYLLARRLGLPHGFAEEWGEWPSVIYRLEPPRERVMLPVLRGEWSEMGTRVYQPMAGRDFVLDQLAIYRDSATVQGLFGSPPSREGKVLIRTMNGLSEYKGEPSADWIPPALPTRQRMAHLLFRDCARLQVQIAKDGPGTRGLGKERKAIVKAQHRAANAVLRDMLERLPNEPQ